MTRTSIRPSPRRSINVVTKAGKKSRRVVFSPEKRTSTLMN
jgi:hypothetical protein